jgi:membrane-associated phospholipid phosphatase
VIEEKKSQKHLRRINLATMVSITALDLGALLSYFFVDERVLSWLWQHPCDWTKNNWVQALGLLGKSYVLVWLLLNWIYISGRTRLAIIAMLALLLGGLIVQPVKLLTHRPRPQRVIEARLEQEDTSGVIKSWSFPSGDTSVVFAAATALAPFVAWPWIPILFALSSAVGLFRIAVLAHYPSDVCAGAAMGIFSGWLILRISRRWLPPDWFRSDRYRTIAGLGVVLIPLFIGVFKGVDDLLVFLKSYGVLFAGIYLIVTVRMWSKQP